MAIKEPRKFVTTDQGHADVLNVPINTLYENDKALDEAIKNIKVGVSEDVEVPATSVLNIEVTLT
ncbi:hypothetical protein [Paenibacillus terrae]|uniref:Uncharacterized protein n=1 Tax=Paenibacillus terrae TaxID=159743 RepID=A0A0D7WVK5_9BACL|nr:hypothetical protein [Paenibacillus terrae]KJD43024.1 hypothetical protein QD47_25005 [Paenibacillus terrae]